MFQRAWFSSFVACRERAFAGRHWDLAATIAQRINATGPSGLDRRCALEQMPTEHYYIENVARGRQVRQPRSSRRSKGPLPRPIRWAVEISLPQDPGQAGKVASRRYGSMLVRSDVRAEPKPAIRQDRAGSVRKRRRRSATSSSCALAMPTATPGSNRYPRRNLFAFPAVATRTKSTPRQAHLRRIQRPDGHSQHG